MKRCKLNKMARYILPCAYFIEHGGNYILMSHLINVCMQQLSIKMNIWWNWCRTCLIVLLVQSGSWHSNAITTFKEDTIPLDIIRYTFFFWLFLGAEICCQLTCGPMRAISVFFASTWKIITSSLVDWNWADSSSWT